jgi:hypothetical protein
MDPDRSADPVRRSPIEDVRAHAAFHLREDGVGVGAGVVRSSFEHGEKFWDCIVRDAHESHYIRVRGSDLGPFPNISAEDVEQGVERFAATLPPRHRLRHLLNANPLHIERDGIVRD